MQMEKTKIPFSTGERILVEIEGLNHAGEGVSHLDGFTVFVPWTAPGDKVEAEVISLKKNYARALPCALHRPSLDRLEADCPHHGICGGCQLQHIRYSKQLHWKRQIVADMLQRLGGLHVKVNPVIGMDDPWSYRNKAQFPVADDNGNLKIGLFEKRSHKVVDVHECLIQHPLNLQAVEVARELIEKLKIPIYNEQTHSGLLRHLLARTSFSKKELLLVLVTNGRLLPGADYLVTQLASRLKNLVGIVQNINTRRGNVVLGEENLLLWGRDYLVEELNGLCFHISAGSFFQVNSRQAAVLFKLVRDYAQIKGGEIIFDLYCGSGAISLFLCKNAGKVIGVESYAPAVRDARKNARLNGITNVEFYTGRAEELMPELIARGYRADIVVVDPPRKGCDEELLAAIVKSRPQRIIYVSCNPATLARDLRYLAASGHIPGEVQPVDMFPHTPHVECVVLMSRL
jgi:23S rRNA (uracil1939-C5)-methyltransferase